jgi:hypothetical protein
VEVGFATVGQAGAHQLMETQQVLSLAALPSEHAALLDGPVSVVLVSRNPNGSTHRCPVELGRDEWYLYLAAGSSRVVDQNLRARSDVSLLLVDPADPYRWLSVTAQVKELVDEAGCSDVVHGDLIDQHDSPRSWEAAASTCDGWPDIVQAIYRVQPDRLMLFEKRRPTA